MNSQFVPFSQDRDSMSAIPHPWWQGFRGGAPGSSLVLVRSMVALGVQGAEPPEAYGFSVLKAQENLFQRVKFT